MVWEQYLILYNHTLEWYYIYIDQTRGEMKMKMMEMETFTDDQQRKMVRDINKLTQIECARLHRFAPAGHPYFRNDIALVSNAFEARFKAVGGMTPEISKLIGWEK